MSKKFQAVLFDLDGTLLDSIPGILASFEHALGKHLPGQTFDRQFMINKIGVPLEQQMLEFADGDANLAETLVTEYRAHNLQLLPKFPLYPNVEKTLTELRQRGYVMGLVTSKFKGSAMVSVEAHRLGRFFDLIMTSDDTTRHKPHPEPLLVAMKRLKLEPTKMVYVGDSVHDINCAHSAGAHAAAAMWGPFQRQDLLALKPKYVLETMDDLLKHV
jgi:pyrophosphatase PpaX